jgi:hypothetical protein
MEISCDGDGFLLTETYQAEFIDHNHNPKPET